MRRVSEFCGVEVLTYAVLDNHFHLLVHVPRPGKLSDTTLVQRYRALYAQRPKMVREVEATLAAGGTQAEGLRTRLMARMHDVSMFLKELKQRFTMWFNARHELFGTIWAERFKSLLVENDPSVLQTVGAYIDLNSLRAKMVNKPEDYRWCGISAAERGNPLARSGVVAMMQGIRWPEARRLYRRFMHEAGAREVKSRPHGTVEIEDAREPFAEPCLLTRQHSLSGGWVIGSLDYVRAHWPSHPRAAT
jgi:REP element-mobilizing transposase RayT